MGDGYFYTLSAIAQSFAALIALIAVFVVFKLQSQKHLHDQLIQNLTDLKTEEMIKHQSWSFEAAMSEQKRWTEDSLITWASTREGWGDMPDRKSNILKQIASNKNFSENILKLLKISFYSNGLTIIISLIFLPWRNLLPNLVQYLFIIVVLILSVLSLLITFNAVVYTIEQRNIRIFDRFFKNHGNTRKNAR